MVSALIAANMNSIFYTTTQCYKYKRNKVNGAADIRSNAVKKKKKKNRTKKIEHINMKKKFGNIKYYDCLKMNASQMNKQ